MSQEAAASTLISPAETSGTPNAPLNSHQTQPSEPLSSSEQTNMLSDGEEQPLESHEVIELQAFSERKAWIEEKIKVCMTNCCFYQ